MADVIDIANPIRTQAILNEYGLHAKKKLGQNFLTDLNILHGIVDTAEITNDDFVLEIGPGIGSLTEQLARAAKKVVALEIDSQMVAVLSDTLQPYDNVKVIENDVLKVDLNELIAAEFGQNATVKVVANLPYYITTPILMQLLRANISWDNIVVMMQREVADRLNAMPGTKEYGVLTLTLQYFAQAQLAMKVAAASFNPAPNVDSAVVKLTPLTPEIVVDQPERLFGVIKGSFSHRRKSLWNNMLQTYGKDAATKEKITTALESAGISPAIRAERLELAEFTTLYLALRAQGLTK
ncbi:16S rRNA (adenine(1518)-N(6)/adenine(1519)-N(6))-dimethyltransferase RsmA [Leuconostoc carnosum]|uniref:Ribosomal RNA small subunit methyltransferase A n=1 Tax=Leuconostoc carnosum (strain JB16) TaxID=1229758 RepID=K0D941_LEUCJ|nr:MULTISPECIES: 16S rRNA (adenine(1518)-N(6)/adenine(1519)-N(6))-dimethyltransferase RsmA [Leuconostoc]AFT81293.1 16S ribosomal RNA methyltransferase KsgA/Dim1 family protein [Leuconostoc carnosum JB16]KAA8326625.1 16S rRNA (adenine(1518)-N(6)/adenine(1519)-N(6))-dimethyltransferase RsmA [Leuconostoc carnosum]KAA8330112.1 16S rRNA (adenine(1518)-N(6)/adenine(1519)-N(6))-dimethyltransferase RsmA [Leuconostoc carnosum]KAA8362186.1 16S rRNA (adenine(1518)-N(6)/adenine(1519)-N(6))-dimethyltransfer